MPRIKAVFFDAAGTLFETREPVGETYARFARDYGVIASAETVNAGFRRVFRGALPLAFGPGRALEELRRLEREWWREVVAKTFAGLGQFNDFEAFFDSLFEFFAEPAHWTAARHAIRTLGSLHERGLTLGVISNFDYRLYRILDGLELSRYFDSISISSEAGYAKPSPRIFQTALERHRLRAEEALHVGDSEHLDVAGASAAGMAAALVNFQMTERMVINGKVAQISSLKEISHVIELLEAN